MPQLQMKERMWWWICKEIRSRPHCNFGLAKTGSPLDHVTQLNMVWKTGGGGMTGERRRGKRREARGEVGERQSEGKRKRVRDVFICIRSRTARQRYRYFDRCTVHTEYIHIPISCQYSTLKLFKNRVLFRECMTCAGQGEDHIIGDGLLTHYFPTFLFLFLFLRRSLYLLVRASNITGW